MGLGPYPEIPLAEAREKAAEARKLTRQGLDPIEHRKAAGAASKGMTFDAAAKAYIQAHKAGWRGARTAHRWRSELDRYASPAFGKRDVATITVDDVLRVLSPIWSTKNETASKVRERIEAVLNWATVKGTAAGLTRPHGAVTCSICCRLAPRSTRSSTTRPCPGRSYPAS